MKHKNMEELTNKQKEVKEKIEKLLIMTKREGIDKLISFLNESDFYIAPASTIYHGSYEGGLAKHSLNVYECLSSKYENPVWKNVFEKCGIKPEELVIAAICHDFCKISFYTIEMKSQKIDGNWKQVPFFTIDDSLPLGHGEKSIIIASRFINLTNNELFSIRWHMGFSEDKSQHKTIGKAMEMYPLTLALHEADLEATHVIEK